MMDKNDIKEIVKGLCSNDDGLFHDKCWALKAVYEGFNLRLVPPKMVGRHLMWRYNERVKLKYGYLKDEAAGFLCNVGEQELWEICDAP